MSFYVYLLESVDKKKTYIGATVDLEHRLKQHNGELAGGAKATRGRRWNRVCAITGFPDWRAALQFEWAWKHHSRRLRGHGLDVRFRALQTLLQSGRSTSAALPFGIWPSGGPQHIQEAKMTARVEKIESHFAVFGKCPPAVPSSFNPSSLLSFQLPSFKMSSIVELSALLSTLTKQVETMNSELAELREFKARLTGAVVPVAAEPKKRGRKPKAAAPVGGAGEESGSDTGEAAAPKKARKPREKAACPAAAEGVIRFFSSRDGEYKCFSNFYKAPITIDGKEYRSVENYFQSQRFVGSDDDYAELVRNQANPALCRAMGRANESSKTKPHKPRADWEAVREHVMYRGLLAKFKSHPELAAILDKTGEAVIEEESPLDDFWGIGKDGSGANMMGKTLMRVRKALRDGEDADDAEDEAAEDEAADDDEESGSDNDEEDAGSDRDE